MDYHSADDVFQTNMHLTCVSYNVRQIENKGTLMIRVTDTAFSFQYQRAYESASHDKHSVVTLISIKVTALY